MAAATATASSSSKASLEWAESLVGRYWEVYWKQEDNDAKEEGEGAGASSSSPGSQQPDPQQRGGHAGTSASQRGNHAGGDARMIDGETDDVDDDDRSTASSSEASHADDWYDAKVISYAVTTTRADKKGSSTAEPSVTFKVRFVGDEDDSEYDMVLTPSIVRPSSRAWIRRTLALLGRTPDRKGADDDNNNEKSPSRPNERGSPVRGPKKVAPGRRNDAAKWFASLPPDTSTLEDQRSASHALGALRESTATGDMPTLPEPMHPEKPGNTRVSSPRSKSTATASSDPFPAVTDVESIRELVVQIRWQVHLRSRLTAVVGDPPSSRGNDDDDVDGPTNDYLDYLATCLQRLESSCLWYYRCYALHARVFGHCETQSPEELLERDYVLKDCFEAGRYELVSIHLIDPSVSASRRKRKANEPLGSLTVSNGNGSSSSPQRRTKRRRKMRSLLGDDDDANADADASALYDMLEQDDFQSMQLVDAFVNKMELTDSRWFMEAFGTMLRSLSMHLVAPIASWLHRATRCIGSVGDDGLDSPRSGDGFRIDDESSTGGDESSDDTNAASSSSRWFRYEEIEAMVESAKSDRVLRKVMLRDLLSGLQEKLSAVDSFSDIARATVLAVLDDDHKGKGVPIIVSDKILLELERLLTMSRSREHPQLRNVEPLGRRHSNISRSVIKRAIVYRNWYLRFLRVSAVRERVSLANAVVSDYPTLPPIDWPQGAPTITSKISQLGSLVDELRKRLADVESLYERYIPLPTDDKHPLATTEGIQKAMQDLSSSCFVAEIEEMMAVRLDILTLRGEVSILLSSDRPLFSDLQRIKAEVNLILQGESASRRELIQNLERDSTVDARIQDFAYQDIQTVLGGEYKRFEALFERITSWKDRAEAIIASLRLHGNDAAGSPLSPQKLPAMVDLKRCRDLLDDSSIVPLDLSNLAESIARIHSGCVEWAESLSAMLMDSALSFEESLQQLGEQNKRRPLGVIMNPTRHVVDSIVDLLVWYSTAKQVCLSDGEFSRFDLIAEGIEIIEAFSESAGVFAINRATALELLARKVPSRGLGKCLSCSKLRSHPLSDSVLSRILEPRGVGDAHPLLCLLHVLWALAVEDFTDRSLKGEGNERYVATAKALLQKRPLQAQTRGVSIMFSDSSFPSIATLTELVTLADSTEADARHAIAETKSLLRECLRRPFDVAGMLSKLKALVVSVKSPISGAGLMIDEGLVQQLDQGVKDVSWLLKAFQYAVLRTRHTQATEQLSTGEGGDPRVPWDILVTLIEKLPETRDGQGDFAFVALKAKDLHDAAAAWQNDVSNATQLSLKGVQRRTQSTAPGQPPETRLVDESNVAELSNDPILREVSMPRHTAMKTMLTATGDFEALLHDFLGKDYEGAGPDRAAYPSPGSLVSSDGAFTLYRLTKSPLFGALRDFVKSISEVAGSVLADTPGKAAFDWIRKVVYWIECLHQSVRLMNLPYGGMKLVIPSLNARQLLADGSRILLDVPNDLRRTLRTHKIFISTNSNGRLTVRTMKGGAHHAIGVTAIRWCPFLYDSLKADYSRYEKWQNDMGDVAGSFVAYSKQPPSVFEESVLCLHRFQDKVSDLLAQALDLVVAPVDATLENANRILWGINSRLAASTPALARKYAMEKYSEPEALVRNRHVLLDSLSIRQLAGSETDEPSVATNTNDGPFRGAARVLLQNALLKAVAALGMDNTTEDAMAFCAMKAWSIENEIFAAFQSETEFGNAKISPEYRDFARALKRSLEDPDNLSFCLSVLTDRVDAESLTRMSILDLANPKTKEERARAAASHNLVLDGASKPASVKEAPSEPVTESQQVPNEGTKVEKKSSPVYPGSSEETGTISSPNRISGHPITQVDRGSTDSVFQLRDVIKATTATTHRPPPPPSLAASLVAVPSASRKSETPATNASGTDRSNVTVSVTSFVAGFVVETDPFDKAERLLPENWVEKGRLKNEEFAKFLRSKLEGGKWSVVAFRMITFSNKDEREHKKYCKEYESRNRLAMFSLAPDSKVFLVTPKFHASVRSLRFENASSTYAVALVRRQSRVVVPINTGNGQRATQLGFAEADFRLPSLAYRESKYIKYCYSIGRMQGKQKRRRDSPRSKIYFALNNCFFVTQRFAWLVLLAASLPLPPVWAAECIVTDECRICTSSDKDQIDQCAETGKVEYMTCSTKNDDDSEAGDAEGGTDRKFYRSCARTKWDDEYLMLRLQVFCLLLGVLSIASLKKQKVVTASLFDQRIAQGRSEKKRASQPSVLEMGFVVSSSEETVPLTDQSTAGLEVV